MVWAQPVRGFLESSGSVSRPETQRVFGLQAKWILGRRGRALAGKNSGKESGQEVLSTSGGYGINPFVTPFSKGLAR